MTESFFRNKRVLVTGACGTVGRELVRQLLDEYRAGELIGLDNNESELFFLEQEYQAYPNANFFLADTRDHAELVRKFSGMDIVFHTAAFKHVSLCEKSPFDAVQTNILGVQNVIQAAFANRVKRTIFTSSDKAANPTNVMGTSKLMGERLITAANSTTEASGPVFASTRFGNVLGSRGSVIPVFREQIIRGGPVTLTDPEMTRFIMSLHQAVQLVIDSAVICHGGEVFVTKMQMIRIKDLAEVMIQELAPAYEHKPGDIRIEVIGAKPGEKLYEELMTSEETRRTMELNRYFVVSPAFKSLYRSIDLTYPDLISSNVNEPYNSATGPFMSQAELKSFLYNNHLLTDGVGKDCL